MDAETLRNLRMCAEFIDGGAGEVSVPCGELRELLTAYKSLQRVSALPDGWREKAELYARSRRHGAEVGASMAERCADELQQALPEGFRNGN